MKMQVTPRLTVFLRKIMGRRKAALCEQCGERPFVTEWAGNGWLICMQCCDQRRADSLSMPGAEGPEISDPHISDPSAYVYAPWANRGGHEPGEPVPAGEAVAQAPAWAWSHEVLDAPVSD